MGKGEAEKPQEDMRVQTVSDGRQNLLDGSELAGPDRKTPFSSPKSKPFILYSSRSSYN